MDHMTVFLEGIAARFYRGIGPEVQYIAPFARMNFFIGANNFMSLVDAETMLFIDNR